MVGGGEADAGEADAGSKATPPFRKACVKAKAESESFGKKPIAGIDAYLRVNADAETIVGHCVRPSRRL